MAVIAAAVLLAACGGPVEQAATAETTAEPATITEAESTTQAESTQPSSDDLLDFALIDRLFSMTYADFCREEGRTVEPEGMYDGGAYCRFSKYGDAAFFFDGAYDAAESAPPIIINPEKNTLNTTSFEARELLVGKRSLTLGELKQWLNEQGIVCTAGENGEGDIRFFFEVGKYEFMGDLESEKDSAPIAHFEVYCKSNYGN
jgi:hypothetical protein